MMNKKGDDQVSDAESDNSSSGTHKDREISNEVKMYNSNFKGVPAKGDNSEFV